MADEKTAEELQEEAAAITAEEGKVTEEEQVETPAPETKPNATEANDKLAGVLEKLAERLTPQMTEEQKKEQLKKIEEETGFTPKQLATLGKLAENTTIKASLVHGKEMGIVKAEKALGKYSAKLKDKVAEAMSKLPENVQANPQNWVDMAHLIKGREADSIQLDDEVQGDDRSVGDGTRVGGGMKGLTSVKKGSGAGGAGGPAKKYDADETLMINTYFSGDAKAYEATKGEKRVGLTKSGDGEAKGAADREYARLTGGQLG